MPIRNLLLFELNEVPFRVLDAFLQRHPESAIAREKACLRQFETFSEDTGHLSPWITWPSVHRGVSNAHHGIGYFGQKLDEVDGSYPPIWTILAKQGRPVGVFGSLHTYPVPKNNHNYTFYVPDSFAGGPECHPSGLAAFQEFNLAMVDASGRNVSRLVPLRAAARFMFASPRLGITARTVVETAHHLSRELLTPSLKCRRRNFQAVFAFDIFFKQLEKTRPQFATFFTNHVASAMHRYWAATFPDDFDQLEYSGDWQRTYSDEIDHAMRCAAAMIGRLVRFCGENPGYRLLIASSMGQAATHGYVVRSQLYLTDLDRFMAKLGLPSTAWSRRRAMQPDVNCVVSSGYLESFRENLVNLQLNEKPLTYAEKEGGFFAFSFGDANLDDRQCNVEYRGKAFPISEFGFENVLIQDLAGSTGYHIPQGILVLYDPIRNTGASSRARISTLDIAPAILRHLGATPPDYMKQQSSLFNALD